MDTTPILDENEEVVVVRASAMVGLVCSEGLVLGINMTRNIIYYISDSIYCCANATGYDHEVMLDIHKRVSSLLSIKNKNITVWQVLDWMRSCYDKLPLVDILLGGEDATGVHLYSIDPYGASSSVEGCIAKGAGEAVATELLNADFNKDMPLVEAKGLALSALKSAALSENEQVKAQLCIITKRKELDSPIEYGNAQLYGLDAEAFI